MKARQIFFAVFAMVALLLNAQSDDSSYLKKVMDKLEAGDCESAQKYYNVYKEVSGKQKPSVQVLIDDCNAANKFQIGSKMTVEGKEYVIAYLTADKQHGFAVRDAGLDDLYYPYSDNRVKEHKIPTLAELDLIYGNNSKIGLTGQYWSRTESDKYRHTGSDAGYHAFLIVKDFITGKNIHTDCRNKSGVLLIHRF